MAHRFRILLGVLIAAAGGVIPVAVLTQNAPPPASDWKIGDVFAGVGRYEVRSGQYLVFNADGTRKLLNGTPETLVDPTARRTGTTTGCMIGPPPVADALLTTSFFNMRVGRFASDLPHAASTAATINNRSAEAIESIVFDNEGNYYVGGMGPRESSSVPAPPGFIFKFSPDNALLATYRVPSANRGADWIDLGTDQKTLYYTSEDEHAAIHVYRPADELGPAAYHEIPITPPTDGTIYAMRLLPPIPGDPEKKPSGFLVAQYWRILRLDPAGQIIQQYVDQAPGSFFALNITPDARSFWTAKFDGGTIVKFHIASGAITKGPIPTGADDVWGLCVKNEYTAAMNTCYELDPDGNSVPGPDGKPRTMTCEVPPNCAITPGDPLCTPPPPPPPPPPPSTCSFVKASPAVLWPPNSKPVPITLVDQSATPLTYRVLAIYQDEPTNYLGVANEAIDAGGVGTSTPWVRAERTGNPGVPGNGRVYEIQFEATDGSCRGSVFTGVPHDQRGDATIDDGIRYDSTVAGGPQVRKR
jgi:sugar lactone lactonase YvrE